MLAFSTRLLRRRAVPTATTRRRRAASSVSARVAAAVDGRVGRITLENPARKNAVTLAMYDQIPAAAATVAGCRVAVLRGAGDVAFGAGSAIDEFEALRTGAEASRRYSDVERKAAAALRALRQPLLAAVHGPCYGGALNLALCADVRYAADDATFCVPPAKLGIGYPRELMDLLVGAVGVGTAKDLLFTARVVDADEALKLGLVQRVVPKADLDATVEAAAATISNDLAPLTLAAAKAMLRGDADADAQTEACYESRDYREGVAAFVERRKPGFEGV